MLSRRADLISFEVYCGQQQPIAEFGVVDIKSGPAAVVRNLRSVFSDKPSEKAMGLVVVNRFYTSIVLATIGTIITNRRGFCTAVVTKIKKRLIDIPRGSFVFARSNM
ncbi:Hypothetical protein PHPALM_19818 [Phytophthora palmivora]|uniref:Uncharacterized protein n=1 Tax=Phytophthora palmivora TaxID=4796 RepID=A0A2P4XGE4_9STRA|nr:Hypothetical protein PHPALM_19818 [Phytophthora palmivora]